MTFHFLLKAFASGVDGANKPVFLIHHWILNSKEMFCFLTVGIGPGAVDDVDFVSAESKCMVYNVFDSQQVTLL